MPRILCRAFSINSCLCTNWETTGTMRSPHPYMMIACTNALRFIYKHGIGALNCFLMAGPYGNGNNLQFTIKDTSYVWGKKQPNLQLLDILACSSTNKKRWNIKTVIYQNIQKLVLFVVFDSYIASILNIVVCQAHPLFVFCVDFIHCLILFNYFTPLLVCPVCSGS